jgi:hypothetical protein
MNNQIINNVNKVLQKAEEFLNLPLVDMFKIIVRILLLPKKLFELNGEMKCLMS